MAIDNLIALPVVEWSKLTVIELLQKFESATANDLSLQPRRQMSIYPSPMVDDTVTANYVEKNAQRNQKKKNACLLSFQKYWLLLKTVLSFV